MKVSIRLALQRDYIVDLSGNDIEVPPLLIQKYLEARAAWLFAQSGIDEVMREFGRSEKETLSSH